MTTQTVPDPSATIWLPVVHITTTFADGKIAWGTGVVVGRNDVLTAGHMVYQTSHGPLIYVEIEPAYDPRTGTGPLGAFLSTTVHYNPGFDPDGDGRLFSGDGQGATRGGSELDLALIDLSTPIGDRTGWYGLDTAGGFREGQASVAGYPGRHGGKLVTDAGFVADDGTDRFVDISRLDVNPGNSGGPVFIENGFGRTVVGIVSTARAAADPAGETWISQRMAANDSLIGGGVRVTGGTGRDALVGGFEADTLTGGSGDDILSGMGGDDFLLGGNLDDRLAGGTGNDLLDGGAGSDTAIVDAARRATTPSGNMARLSLSGPEGEDVLTGVETVGFLDGRLLFDANPTAATVTRMYRAALGRDPDREGLETWSSALDARTPLRALADGFRNSPEFAARFGAPDNDAFVDRMYANVLDRAPDAAGKANWVNAMAHGMGQSAVLVGFSESPENRLRTTDIVGRGIFDYDDTMTFIGRLYDTALDRSPDLGGARNWASAMAGGMSAGAVAQGFFGSDEFNARYGGLSDTGFVDRLYRNTLDRAPDAGGLNHWVGVLANGGSRAEVALGFSDSLEHTNMLYARWGGEGITFA